MKTVLLFVCLAVFVTAPSSEAEMYKWVEADGSVTFKDTPPPPSRKRNKVKVYRDSDFDPAPVPAPVQPGRNAAKTPAVQPPAPEPSQRKAAAKQVELFVTEWCGYCKKAESFLNQNNIAYTRYDIEKDKDAAERKRSLGGGRGVPFALIGGQPVSGFNQSVYKSMLGL